MAYGVVRNYYTGNLVRDIDNYLRDEAEARSRLQVCDCCGDEITSDKCFMVDDLYYCKDCETQAREDFWEEHKKEFLVFTPSYDD